MTNAVQSLLNSFDRLTESERIEAALEILRRSKQIEYASLSDNDLTALADELFSELDHHEASS